MWKQHCRRGKRKIALFNENIFSELSAESIIDYLGYREHGLVFMDQKYTKKERNPTSKVLEKIVKSIFSAAPLETRSDV